VMARDLERTYFRIQQGDYFVEQFQGSSGPHYVRLARRFYQLAPSRPGRSRRPRSAPAARGLAHGVVVARSLPDARTADRADVAFGRGAGGGSGAGRLAEYASDADQRR
jgi:hypothetical protein